MIVTAFAVLATVLTVGCQPKLFTSVALIRIHYASEDIVRAASPDGQDQRDNPVITDSIVFMSSPSFLRMVAEKENLYRDPEFSPEQTNPLSDESASRGQVERHIVENAVIDALAGRLVVAQRGGSHVISVEATSADPKKAARLANTAVEIFTETELSRLEGLEKESLDWLTHTIRASKGELAGLEGSALELASKHGLHQSREDPFITQETSVQWTELTTQLASIKAEQTITRARYKNVRSWIANHGAEAILAIAKSPALDELRNVETILAGKMSELEQQLGERHPTIVNLRNELTSVRQRMLDEANAVLHTIRNDLIINNAREAEIEAQIEMLSQKMIGQQKSHAELQETDRLIKNKIASLEALTKKQIRIKEQQMVRKGLSNIMSPASIPTTYDYPKLWPLIAYISFGTIGLCLLGIFFRDRWVSDFGFTSPEDVRALSMKPIGIVPELTGELSRETAFEDYVVTQPNSVQAEAVQRVRNHLCKLRQEDSAAATVVSIISSSPQEGKTTMAVALARQAAVTGSRVLFIDADVRHPNVPALLGLEVGAGLCELLFDDRQSHPRIEQDPRTTLHILQAGNFTGSSADLFNSGQMNRLMRELRLHYDWIFFDSPSIGAVVDGVILSKHADFVVYVARWLETTRNVVKMGVNQLSSAGIRCIGVALTRVDMDAYQKYQHMEELKYYGYSSVGTSENPAVR